MDKRIEKWYEDHSNEVVDLAKHIWEQPETAFEEYKACRMTSDFLKRHGFDVYAYNCYDKTKEPNAIVASWGTGKPVIGILGEYDALAGLGQDAVPFKSPKPGSGHGCGHCLIAPACSSAAIATKAVMEAEGLSGTIKFFATPAEEGGSGKLYMARDGMFKDVDCMMFWHPQARNITPYEVALAAISIMKVEFFGKTSHAGRAPEQGRSALDAAELMNIGVQYLREHVATDCRMHYSYLATGERPNIVPEYAALLYYIRSKDLPSNKELLERVKKVGEGAAMMTETEVKFTVNSMGSETFIVHSFNRFFYESMKKVPAIKYTKEEEEFAKTIYENVVGKKPEGDVLFRGIDEPTGVTKFAAGSTDCGYITYTIPTSRLFGYGVVHDIPGHHWAVTALSGMGIGHKGMLFASKAIAQCSVDILRKPEVINEWWEEHRALKGDKAVEPIWPPESPQ